MQNICYFDVCQCYVSGILYSYIKLCSLSCFESLASIRTGSASLIHQFLFYCVGWFLIFHRHWRRRCLWIRSRCCYCRSIFQRSFIYIFLSHYIMRFHCNSFSWEDACNGSYIICYCVISRILINYCIFKVLSNCNIFQCYISLISHCNFKFSSFANLEFSIFGSALIGYTLISCHLWIFFIRWNFSFWSLRLWIITIWSFTFYQCNVLQISIVHIILLNYITCIYCYIVSRCKCCDLCGSFISQIISCTFNNFSTTQQLRYYYICQSYISIVCYCNVEKHCIINTIRFLCTNNRFLSSQ